MKMIAEVKNFQDGTPAEIMVFRRKDGQDVFVAKVDAAVSGNKVEASWQHEE